MRTLGLGSAVVIASGLKDVPLCQERYLLVKEVEGVALESPVVDADVEPFVDVRSYGQA